MSIHVKQGATVLTFDVPADTPIADMMHTLRSQQGFSTFSLVGVAAESQLWLSFGGATMEVEAVVALMGGSTISEFGGSEVALLLPEVIAELQAIKVLTSNGESMVSSLMVPAACTMGDVLKELGKLFEGDVATATVCAPGARDGLLVHIGFTDETKPMPVLEALTAKIGVLPLPLRPAALPASLADIHVKLPPGAKEREAAADDGAPERGAAAGDVAGAIDARETDWHKAMWLKLSKHIATSKPLANTNREHLLTMCEGSITFMKTGGRLLSARAAPHGYFTCSLCARLSLNAP